LGHALRGARALALAQLACFGLAACHSGGGGGSAPVGQVIAVVDGREITMRNVDVELGGALPADPKARAAAQQAALHAIVSRIILADEARAQGLDKTPEFALRKEAAIDAMLAQSLASKFAASVPAAAPDEAQTFVAAHPDSFAERKIFTVDQVRTNRPPDAALIEALKPLNSLDDVETLLQRQHIEYHRVTTDLDVLALDPKTAASISALPPNEVFVIPTGGAVLISQIKQSRVQPFTGDPATQYALRYIQAQRSREATQRAVNAILATKASAVRYNPGFAPAPAAPPATTGAVGT
jgi:EpsD family peptidyl-prolyl cis-trans isomerase